MTWRQRAGRDRGAFTAELAAGLPALVLLLLVGITAIGAVTTKAQCVDAAREAALVSARGGDGVAAGARAAPSDAEVSVAIVGDTAVATVRASVRVAGARLPSISVVAEAVAALEPGIPEP